MPINGGGGSGASGPTLQLVVSAGLVSIRRPRFTGLTAPLAYYNCIDLIDYCRILEQDLR